jgi:single-strand DNA-binding protein
MADLNKVMLIGNLTRDPEVKYTPKGTPVGDLGLAINTSYKTADGQVKEEVCYVTVEVWGRQAENCKEYLAKGRSVFIEGRLQFEQWESNGEKKSRMKVRAERVQFLGGPGRSGSGSGASSNAGSSRPARSVKAEAADSEADAPAPADDDIPF